jgi:hypothetical protein
MNKISKTITTTLGKSDFLGKLMSGELGMARTIWKYTIFPLFISNLIMNVFLKEGDNNIVVLILFVAFQATYILAAAIGIWRASNKYQGKAFWSYWQKCILCFYLFRL